MRDDDVVDALLERSLDDCEGVVAREVARREDEVVARDRTQHVPRRRQEPTFGVRDVNRVDAQPKIAKLVLEARPLGNLVALLRLVSSCRLGRGVDGGHPYDARTLACGDLDREGVHAADRPVEGQRAEDVDAGYERGDDLRALCCRGVVGLQREPGEPEVGEVPCERVIVDPPHGHVRSHVDVEIVRPFHEPACAVTRCSRSGRLGRHEGTPRASAASSASCAALADAILGSTPSSTSRSRAACISSTRRAACLRLPSSARARNGRPIIAPISSASQSACPVALGRLHALDDGGSESLHEHRAHELQPGRVAGLLRDHFDGHAERLEQLREGARSVTRCEDGCLEPACWDRAEERYVGETRSGAADERREPAFQLG